MEEEQEYKFVCKICSKSFFSGKSLGGHMRGHLAKKSPKKHEDQNNTSIDLESGGDFGYGLRENPLKSWRVSDSKKSIEREQNHCCKECGKEFPSLRAVSGHMRCHSTKATTTEEHCVCRQCGKGFASMRALFGHMRHHSKRSRPLGLRSSESQTDHKRSRIRYKINENISSSNLNSSSCVSEIGEEEEAAKCLMMLSRGMRNWVEFNSILEESGNYSIIFKDKAMDRSEGEKFRKVKKLREKLDSSRVSCSRDSLFGEKNGSEFDDLDSGFFRNNDKKVKLEVSTDGFHKDKGVEFMKSDIDGESEIESSDVEIENGSEEPIEVEFEKGLVRKVGLELDRGDLELMNSNTESNYKLEFNELKKSKDRTCPICFKVFSSGQGLGGHKRAHYNELLEKKTKMSVSAKQDRPNIHNVLDLNVSVTLENEDADDDVEFEPWWVRSDHGFMGVRRW